MWFKRPNKKEKFSHWIERYHAALYRHALWMTGQPDLAADMVQETYYQAWQSLGKLRDDDHALPWLLIILRRAVYREHRQQCRFDHLAREFGMLENKTKDDVEDNELLDLCHSLEALSPSHRETLLLYALHGFTYQEISEQLDIPVGTVMSRISRARAALNRLLNDNQQHAKVVSINRNKRIQDK